MKHLKKQTLILLSISSLLLVGLAVFVHFDKKGGASKLLQP